MQRQVKRLSEEHTLMQERINNWYNCCRDTDAYWRLVGARNYLHLVISAIEEIIERGGKS